MKRRVAVRGIAYQDGKLLCVEHKDKDGNPAGFYATPGGGLDAGESMTDGIVREFIEETGITPKVGRLLFIQQFSWIGRSNSPIEQLEFFFLIENPEAYENVDLSLTSHGEAELVSCTFIDPKTANLLPIFLRSIELERYVHEVKPVEHFNYLNDDPVAV
jgi:8-oxo-dGTP pyrophosphatase MutT (NUDIX family)